MGFRCDLLGLYVGFELNLYREKSKKLREEPFVHLLVHLVKHKPISDATVLNIMLNMFCMTIAAQKPDKE